MTQHPLSGVYVAAVTPIHEAPPKGERLDSSPDLEAVPALLEFLASRGCHGALLFGTTGEGPSFSLSERAALMRSASIHRQQLNGFRLLAGTGTPSLGESINLTKLAFDLGYDGVVVLPPYYFRKATDDGLFNWFSELINKAVPKDGYLLGYHFPNVAGIGFSIGLLSRLKDAFPTQFAGIKDSSHDQDFARAVGQKFSDDLLILTGTDSYLQFAMQNHAGGCITALANLLSPGLREIWNMMRAGSDPSDMQVRVTKQRQILEKYLPYPPLLKALLNRLYDFPRWAVKPPLEMLKPELEEAVFKEISPLL
jgi:4-hydroxy-tetrahydrodipicolinate synthase